MINQICTSYLLILLLVQQQDTFARKILTMYQVNSNISFPLSSLTAAVNMDFVSSSFGDYNS